LTLSIRWLETLRTIINIVIVHLILVITLTFLVIVVIVAPIIAVIATLVLHVPLHVRLQGILSCLVWNERTLSTIVNVVLI